MKKQSSRWVMGGLVTGLLLGHSVAIQPIQVWAQDSQPTTTLSTTPQQNVQDNQSLEAEADPDEVAQIQALLALWQNLIETYRVLEDREGESQTLNSLGNAYFQLGQYQQALDAYHQSLLIAEEINNLTIIGITLGNLGNVYFHTQDYAKAIEFYQRALTPLQESNDLPNQSIILGNLGSASLRLNEYQQAADFYNQQLLIVQQLSESAKESLILTNIGNIHNILGQYDQAIDVLGQSLDMAKATNNPAAAGEALSSLGTAYRNLGKYSKAIDSYRQALTIFEEIGDYESQGIVLGNLGIAYDQIGQYQEAIALYQVQIANAKKFGDEASEAQALGNLAGTYLNLGRSQYSIDYYEQALERVEETGDRRGISQALIGLGNTYYYLEQYDDAIIFYKRSLAVAQDIDDRRSLSQAFGGLGNAYSRLGEYQQSIDFYQQQLAINREINNRAGESHTLGNLGNVYLKLNQYDQALIRYEQNLTLTHELGDPIGKSITLNNLGALYAAQNQLELATVLYKQSINLREQNRAAIRKLPVEDQLIYYNQLVEDPYRNLADLLLQQNRLVEAQRILELLKLEEVREYTRSLDAVPASEGIRYTPTEQQAIDQYNRLIELRQYINQCQQTDCTELDSLQAQEQTFTQAYEQQVQLLETVSQPVIDSDFLRFADLRNTAWDIIEAQPNTMVIYPLVLDERLWLLWIAPDGRLGRAVVPVTQTEIGEAAIQFRSLLDNPYSDIGELQATAQQVHNWLIQPLAGEMVAHQVQNLVFSLDRATRYIPMAALFDGEQYLVENYAVSTIVSAGLTNPADRLPAARQDNFVLAMGLSKAKSGFSPLPNVPIELDGILQDDPADTAGVYPGVLYLDESFTIDSLKQDLPQRSILHIATHAQFDPDSPLDSYLLLGDGDKLQISEINTLSDLTNVSLVVLSACQTALGGPDEEGLEIAGIGLYFLDGNGDRASSLAASLWQVSDRSTSNLMQRFYQILAAETETPVTKAEALRKAQLSLLYDKEVVENDGERFTVRPLSPDAQANPAAPQSHPYYWAPFILVGNPL